VPRASEVAGTFLVLFWYAKENVSLQSEQSKPSRQRTPAPQSEKPDAQPRKPAAQHRPDKPEGADAQAKHRRRRRGGSRKPAGESQPQKSE